MNILLGIRMTLAGGRESLARMALMAVGITIAVPLILVAIAGLPVMQSHIDRLAWHRTTADSPPTAPDPALWLAVTDRFEGHDVIRVHVAALGPRPPVPPGIERLPAPGEKFVSPALAELMRTVPDDQLDNRFPGRVAGSIGPDGLLMPDELVAVVGHTPEQMRAMGGTWSVTEVRGIEQPGERLDWAAIWGIFFGMIAVLVICPVAVFVAMTTQVGGARRELRFAAVRMAGATRLQTAVLAATETALAAVAGTLLGWLAFYALRPVVASQVTLGHGMPIFADDVRVPLVPLLVVLLAVPLVAVGTTLAALHPVQMTPLGVRQRTRRRPPSLWRLTPILFGFVGLWYAVTLSNDANADYPAPVRAALSMGAALSILSILVGFFLTGALLCMWTSRGLTRVSRSATTLVVARRIAADPYATFRMVGATAIAIYVATSLGFAVAANDHPSGADNQSLLSPGRPVLDPGVVAVHVQGVPEAELTPLMSSGAVVVRLGPSGYSGQSGQIVASCADLARVTDLGCPPPTYQDGVLGDQDYLRAVDLFTLPHPGATAADIIFWPDSFAEPGPDAGQLPVQTLLIPTDGTAAAQERIRTLAAATLPASRSKTSDDLAAGPPLDVTAVGNVLPYALVFVLIFTACSMTVSVITGVLERRRPFAVLRASGVRLGELRRIVLLETGAPLALTALFGVGLATLQSLATIPPEHWILPSAGYLAGLGGGLLAAFAISLIALPFMDTATRLDTVRYE